MPKSFKDRMTEKAVNPTMQFITSPSAEETVPEPEEHIPAAASKRAYQARRALPQYAEETKSRRLQLLLTPSLYEAVKDSAAEEQMSVNEYINYILKNATTKKRK